MKLKKFLMAKELLATFLKGVEQGYKAVDVPADMEVYQVYEDFAHPDRFWIIVKSETFPELDGGQAIPEMEPITFRQWNGYPVSAK